MSNNLTNILLMNNNQILNLLANREMFSSDEVTLAKRLRDIHNENISRRFDAELASMRLRHKHLLNIGVCNDS